VKNGLPKLGVSLIAISSDSLFCATKNENSPNYVWIWDLTLFTLNTILIQKHEVLDLKFSPKLCNLNVSTGDGKIYLWSPRGASVCQVPVNKQNFSVNEIVWNPNAKNFAALDTNGLVFVYPQLEFFYEKSVV
jgi:WD40 repeat protein